MIYLYILNTSIYRYIIYIIGLILMAILNNGKKTTQKAKIILFVIYMVIGMIEIVISI